MEYLRPLRDTDQLMQHSFLGGPDVCLQIGGGEGLQKRERRNNISVAEGS